MVDLFTLIFSLLSVIAGTLPSLLIHEARTAFLGITMTAILLYDYYEGLTQQDLSADLAPIFVRLMKAE